MFGRPYKLLDINKIFHVQKLPDGAFPMYSSLVPQGALPVYRNPEPKYLTEEEQRMIIIEALKRDG